MQDNARKVTYGAMMIALFAILLAITVYVPLFGLITTFFIPLPIILYRLRYDRAASILVVITGIFMSLLGGLALFPFAVLFGLLGLVIGDTIQSGKTKLYTFMASGLTILVISMLTYVATIAIMGVNMIEAMTSALQESQEEMFLFMENYGELPKGIKEQVQTSVDLTLAALPSIFIIGSFSIGLIIVLLNMPLVKRFGHTIATFPPLRLMKLPLITVWCYLLILLLPLFTTVEEGTTLYLLFVNATIILRLLFVVQGISLIHHFMHETKKPKWLTVMLTIIAIPLSPITILLGIIDVGMNIRTWIGRNKSS